jgi:hypothetical protein
MADLTWQCDSGSCEHETEVRHQQGAGVFCRECYTRRVANSFDPEAEQRSLDIVEQQQKLLVPQTDE